MITVSSMKGFENFLISVYQNIVQWEQGRPLTNRQYLVLAEAGFSNDEGITKGGVYLFASEYEDGEWQFNEKVWKVLYFASLDSLTLPVPYALKGREIKTW